MTNEQKRKPKQSPQPRFFIANPGTPVKTHADQQWVRWEVGDHKNGNDRVCLTSCRRKAEMIRDALEAYHAPRRYE